MQNKKNPKKGADPERTTHEPSKANPGSPREKTNKPAGRDSAAQREYDRDDARQEVLEQDAEAYPYWGEE